MDSKTPQKNSENDVPAVLVEEDGGDGNLLGDNFVKKRSNSLYSR